MTIRSTLDWDTDGRDWPNREVSRFVTVGDFRWHVQAMGEGPALLLLHGTGASTHSFRDLAPQLAARFRVMAVDLPGHGFSDTPDAPGRTLPGMAGLIGNLLAALAVAPAFVAGHSAGAAILLRMCLDGRIDPAGVVSLNGALLGFRGLAGQIFAPMAKLLALNPFVPMAFAWRAGDKAVVERLLRETGSRIDEKGVRHYGRLAANAGHVAGALAMMASWDLKPLEHDLSRLSQPLYLVVGTGDKTVSPEQAAEVKRIAPHAEIIRLRGLGHLAHEEQAERVAGLIAELAERSGVLPARADQRSA
jgi:magnesium chelatase accessory protein